MKRPTAKRTRTMIGVMVLCDMLDLMINEAVDAGLMVEVSKISRVRSFLEFRHRKTGKVVAVLQPLGSDRLAAVRAVAAHMVETIDKMLAKKAPVNSLRKGHRL